MKGLPRVAPKRVVTAMASLGLAVALLTGTAACAATEPPTAGGPTTFRRINEVQYARSIEDIFGPGIKIPGRFEPPLRADGLLAIGDSKVVVTPSGFEQYELKAREIAAQVVAEDRRSNLPCTPKSPSAGEDACVRKIIVDYGRLIFRRPLTGKEMATALTTAQAAARSTNDGYKGLESGLAWLLVSPNFVFRIEASEPDPERKGQQRLDRYSLATRLSFLLWDAPPDATLLAAAESGALLQARGLEREVNRMLASPKLMQGARSFFSDMLGFEQFDGLSKDQAIYKRFTSQLAKDAKEQALRTIVALLVSNRADYRDLFTTKVAFMNRNLAALYGVPVTKDIIAGWAPYTFAADEPRAGLLTQSAFLMLDPTHEGKTSPTIRGKVLRELFLCQIVPPPPGNVDFTKFQDPKNSKATVRERLESHRENPTCAGCHSITDPIGLAMEQYDPIGEYRTTERGAPIDTAGMFDGKPYKNLIELETVLHDSADVPACAVQRTFEYGVGRQILAGERDWLRYETARFADDKYVFPEMLRRIALSKAFQAVAPDNVATAN